ncbi:hypothetical protein [Bdellovibrio sp. HCB209]|uniref:hypothetical protein n=1 Tax=Bdellovibrio sp. HCB209 TaxID=3394354 RepID=UPI0039B67363
MKTRQDRMIDDSTIRRIKMAYENMPDNESMVSPEEFLADPMVPLISMGSTILKAQGKTSSADALNLIDLLTNGVNPFTVDDLDLAKVSPKDWYGALAKYLKVPKYQIMPMALQLKGY